MPDSTISRTHALAAFTLLAALLGPVAVMAQDRGNVRALDSLGSGTTRHKPASHPRHAAHHAQAVHPASADTKSLAAAAPAIPAAAPPPPVIKAPVLNVPLHPEPPPPPVPAIASAVGEATPIAGGARIGFGAGSADMNPATIQAVRSIAVRMQSDPTTRARIDAYAPGAEDDPSSPRRTALERGLAVRAVLINAGISSTRIYVRAIGQPHDDGPPDRIDLTCSDSTQQKGATQ